MQQDKVKSGRRTPWAEEALRRSHQSGIHNQPWENSILGNFDKPWKVQFPINRAQKTACSSPYEFFSLP